MRQNERKSKELPTEKAVDMTMMWDNLKWQCPHAKARKGQTCVSSWRKSGIAVKTAPLQRKGRNNCTISLGFTSQAVASSTSVHRICATGHEHAADALPWSEIYVYKISGSKRTDGNKAWGSPFSHVQPPPTLLARGDVVLLLAAK